MVALVAISCAKYSNIIGYAQHCVSSMVFLQLGLVHISCYSLQSTSGDGPLTTDDSDDMMVELVPPESRNKASLPRRGSLPDKDFRYKPDFPARVRSSSPRKPRQSPEIMKRAFNFEDAEISTTSSSSEDSD